MHTDWDRLDKNLLANEFWKQLFELRKEFIDEFIDFGQVKYTELVAAFSRTLDISPLTTHFGGPIEKMSILEFSRSFRNIVSAFQVSETHRDAYVEFRHHLKNLLDRYNLTADWCTEHAERQLAYWFNNETAAKKKEAYSPALVDLWEADNIRKLREDVQLSYHSSGLSQFQYWEFRRWKAIFNELSRQKESIFDKDIPSIWRLRFLVKAEFWVRYHLNGIADPVVYDIFFNSISWPGFPYLVSNPFKNAYPGEPDSTISQATYNDNPKLIPGELLFHFRDFWRMNLGEEKRDAKRRILQRFNKELDGYLDLIEDNEKPVYPEEDDWLSPDQDIPSLSTQQLPHIRPLHVSWAVRRIVNPVESTTELLDVYEKNGKLKVHDPSDIRQFSVFVAKALDLTIPGSKRGRQKKRK